MHTGHQRAARPSAANFSRALSLLSTAIKPCGISGAAPGPPRYWMDAKISRSFAVPCWPVKLPAFHGLLRVDKHQETSTGPSIRKGNMHGTFLQCFHLVDTPFENGKGPNEDPMASLRVAFGLQEIVDGSQWQLHMQQISIPLPTRNPEQQPSDWHGAPGLN